jgi:hypothetical protein
MGCERMAEGVATCWFGEACAFYGLLHSLLDHAWIKVVAALYSTIGVLPAIPLGNNLLPTPFTLSVPISFRQRMRQDHRSPTRRQILLMHDADRLKMMPQDLELGAGE